MKPFLILFAATFLFACKDKSKTETTAVVSNSRLSLNSLYNTDSIKAALVNVTTAQQEGAKKKFLEAIDLYKNQNRVFMSLKAFKESLLIYPSEKTYFELGCALADNTNYDEALKAFHIAEMMQYSPLSKVMYKIAAVYGMIKDDRVCSDEYTRVKDSMALHYMQVALQMGYPNPADFSKDKAFDSLRMMNEWQYKEVIRNAMSGNKDPEKLAWDNFKSEFPPLTLPLAINTVWIYQQKYENAIAYDYEKFIPEMRTGKFSREVENEYFYVGKVREDSVYSALMYAGKNMWVLDGRGYSPVYIYLVTYSPSGKIIDKMLVGGQKIFTDNFKTMQMKENLNFEVKDYKNIYEKDPEADGYEKNNVKESKLLTTNYYKVNNKGKFEKTVEMAAN